ncbi:MAG TPA: hypothetical protein VMD05_05035 [Candidatus Nanoarchaeia archaeon]|nr:hypothetical protein [Candidatus Nanoarchaeia archaeon]
MRKFALAALFLFILIAFPASTTYAISVGVKKGDWIEYKVAVTGDMPDHDAQWARTDVVDVQGSVLNLNMTTQFTNGTYLYENITLNLETGQLGDDFFIPANMSVGDTFYDAHVGNITITGSSQRTYAGAERTVLSGQTNVTSFYWDKQTGILVEAYSNYSNINFTMKTVANKTDMWQTQVPEFNASTIFVAVVTIMVAALIICGIRSRRARQSVIN